MLDSASMYFRAFFGVPDSVRAPDGTPVNAVRGFLDAIATLVTARRPARLVACWDEDWRPAFRVRALPSYKAHRTAADGVAEDVQLRAALPRTRPDVHERAAHLGVPHEGWQILDAHRHAHVVHRAVGGDLDRPIRERSAAEEPDVAGSRLSDGPFEADPGGGHAR